MLFESGATILVSVEPSMLSPPNYLRGHFGCDMRADRHVGFIDRIG
jgi:hypothetical protein